MSSIDSNPAAPARNASMSARTPTLNEDWWAVLIGLLFVAAAAVLFSQGSSLKWLAVTPAKWSEPAALGRDLLANAPRYLTQLLVWLVGFSIVIASLGQSLRAFVPSFLFVFVLSLAVFAFGQWTEAVRYNLEPPLVALFLGLLISNTIRLPRGFEAGFRVELYVKVGIVLLGATLPFTLLLWAGPIAILQASIVSVVTFLVIYAVAVRLGLDKRLAATLGAGGSICGVSAAIAIAGAVGAKKDDAPLAISLVVLWAIVMIFALPFAAYSLGLSAGVGGAWIGTSEFADAAGFAAAETYGRMAAGGHGLTGTADQAVWSFTLMKVVGRDAWIGIWAFVLAIVATTRWDRVPGVEPKAGEIWRRFPKFIIGLLIASITVTLLTRGYDLAAYNSRAVPTLVAPLKDLRSWAFTFCFLSIGLTTRFADLKRAGSKPVIAFSAGVAVNVLLGLALSAWVFAHYWENLSR